MGTFETRSEFPNGRHAERARPLVLSEEKEQKAQQKEAKLPTFLTAAARCLTRTALVWAVLGTIAGICVIIALINEGAFRAPPEKQFIPLLAASACFGVLCLGICAGGLGLYRLRSKLLAVVGALLALLLGIGGVLVCVAAGNVQLFVWERALAISAGFAGLFSMFAGVRAIVAMLRYCLWACDEEIPAVKSRPATKVYEFERRTDEVEIEPDPPRKAPTPRAPQKVATRQSSEAGSGATEQGCCRLGCFFVTVVALLVIGGIYYKQTYPLGFEQPNILGTWENRQGMDVRYDFGVGYANKTYKQEEVGFNDVKISQNAWMSLEYRLNRSELTFTKDSGDGRGPVIYKVYQAALSR